MQNCYIKSENFSFLKCKYQDIFTLKYDLFYQRKILEYFFNSIFAKVRKLKLIKFVELCFVPAFIQFSRTA